MGREREGEKRDREEERRRRGGRGGGEQRRGETGGERTRSRNSSEVGSRSCKRWPGV